jgi:hypothetical protein
VEVPDTRMNITNAMREEMQYFVKHAQQVIFQKRQTQLLLETFHRDEIIVKTDFIQNIVHGCGQETLQSYYGK